MLDARTRRILARAVVLTAVAGALVGFELHGRAKHLRTVEPGVLYRSATLPPEQLAEVIDRYGIKTVVNLRSVEERAEGSWYNDEAALLARKGVTLRDLPLYSGWPPNELILTDWLEILTDPAQHPVLVHCEHGVIRTGIMLGVRDLELGTGTPESAYDKIERFGKPLKEPIRSRLQEYLRSYVPRWGARLTRVAEPAS